MEMHLVGRHPLASPPSKVAKESKQKYPGLLAKGSLYAVTLLVFSHHNSKMSHLTFHGPTGPTTTLFAKRSHLHFNSQMSKIT